MQAHIVFVRPIGLGMQVISSVKKVLESAYRTMSDQPTFGQGITIFIIVANPSCW